MHSYSHSDPQNQMGIWNDDDDVDDGDDDEVQQWCSNSCKSESFRELKKHTDPRFIQVGQALDLCLATKFPGWFWHQPLEVETISVGIRQTWVHILPP